MKIKKGVFRDIKVGDIVICHRFVGFPVFVSLMEEYVGKPGKVDYIILDTSKPIANVHGYNWPLSALTLQESS